MHGEILYCTYGNMGEYPLLLSNSPFIRSSWKLDERYKRRDAREHLAERLSTYITYLAAVNLLLMPILFVWQLIFQIVHYAEVRAVKLQGDQSHECVWHIPGHTFQMLWCVIFVARGVHLTAARYRTAVGQCDAHTMRVVTWLANVSNFTSPHVTWTGGLTLYWYIKPVFYSPSSW